MTSVHVKVAMFYSGRISKKAISYGKETDILYHKDASVDDDTCSKHIAILSSGNSFVNDQAICLQP